MARRLVPVLLLACIASCSNRPLATRYRLEGTVTGLEGSGLVLQLNGGDDVTVRVDGVFLFGPVLADQETYNVSVQTHPSLPTQRCTVARGSGTVNAANITGVEVTCVTQAFAVGATVTGLEGTGLVLRNNGADELTINANGLFRFNQAIKSGQPYAISVATQPTLPTQSCTVSTGFGTIGSFDVLDPVVSCLTRPVTIGGTVTGLAGAGLVLQNNGAADLPVLPGAASYAFTVPRDTPYLVTVKAQPTNPRQTCLVANPGGKTASVDVQGLDLTCTTELLTVGGTITGLAGSGLVLHNSDGTNLPVAAGATSYSFNVPSNGGYAITITSQPVNPTQVCTIANGTGTVPSTNVSNVHVTCATSSFTVGGTISGLLGSGLVLQNNGGSDLAVPAGATTYSFPAASGSSYAVSVKTQPSAPNQVCSVSNPAGTVTNANVINLTINCATTTFAVGGTVTGLLGTGLTLQNNGGADLPLAPGTTQYGFTVPSGGPYAVTIKSQPVSPTQLCTVVNSTGTVTTNVSNVHVSCVTATFTVGGTITGLSGAGLVLQNVGGSNLTLPPGSTSYTFPAASGSPYAVSVLTQPSNPTQSCAVSNASGTVTGANVTNVNISCTTTSFSVGGSVSGLAGTGLVLQNNLGGDLSLAASATSYAFTVASNSAYAISVKTHPASPTQVCTVANPSGTVANVNVTNATVTCVTTPFPVGGSISGLVGSGLVLTNNGGSDLPLGPSATSYSFSVPSGAAYSVAVKTQPSNPAQVCTVAMPSGTVPNAAVTDLAITCTCSPYCPRVLLLAGTRSLTAGHVAASYVPGGAWTTTRLTGSTQSGTALAILDDGTAVGLVHNNPDDVLKSVRWTGAGWSPLAAVGAGITTRSRPSLGGGPVAEAVFQGTDFKHYNTTFNGSWGAIGTVGTPLVPQVFGPSAAQVLSRSPGNFTVAYIADSTNRCTTIDFTATLWQSPLTVSTEVTDFWKSPALVAPTAGPAMLVVWLASTNNQFRFSTYSGGVWAAAADIVNATSPEPAALLALPGGEVLMAFRGLDGKLYALSYSAGAWGLPTAVAGGVLLEGSPALARGQGGALAELAYVGPTGIAYHLRLAANRTWSAPVQVDTSVDFVSLVSGP